MVSSRNSFWAVMTVMIISKVCNKREKKLLSAAFTFLMISLISYSLR